MEDATEEYKEDAGSLSVAMLVLGVGVCFSSQCGLSLQDLAMCLS